MNTFNSVSATVRCVLSITLIIISMPILAIARWLVIKGVNDNG